MNFIKLNSLSASEWFLFHFNWLVYIIFSGTILKKCTILIKAELNTILS